MDIMEVEMKRMKKKARTVITTDGEVDDMNSVIRFLLYSNDMDLAGIILTSSMYHYAGDPDKNVLPFRWTGTNWIFDLIDRYEQVYPCLKIHDKYYPEPQKIREMVKIGNITNVGEMEQMTEGAEFLTQLFLDNDPRPLYVQTWGGTNTTARALKNIEDEYKETPNWKDIQKFIYDKLIIYIILDQDDSYTNYIAKKWPELKIINDRFNFWHFAYAWKMHCPEVNQRLTADWFKENIKFNHGALLEHYALMGDGQYIDGELEAEQHGSQAYLTGHPEYQKYDFISEGDSPSFFYLIDNGLRSLEDPSYGGWGGRFCQKQGHLYLNDCFDYNPYTKQYEAEYSLERWFDDIQNDFACRADWCVADRYEKANHAPVVSIKEGLNIDVLANEVVQLHAEAFDLDGDHLSYHWWRYYEADTYGEIMESDIKCIGTDNLILSKTRDGKPDESIKLENSETDVLTIHIPRDIKKGQTIHIILEVKDDGTPSLKKYQRVILTAK